MVEATRRLLGVFAHPDDEVFCAGGTLAKYCADGAEAMVLCATRGDAGQIRDAAVATRRNLGEVREAELRRACACLGVDTVRCLDHGDGRLRDVGVEALADEIRDVVHGFSPDVVITFGDDGAYGHPDHVAISAATTRAVEHADADGVRLYHSYFPRRGLLLRERLASWLVALDSRFRGSTDFASALSLFAEESTTMRFASDGVTVRYYPPGFAIVEQGEPSAALYFLLIGEVDVVRHERDGSRHQLARLGSGEFFGELGVVRQQARSADVVAVTSVACLELAAPEPTLYAGRGEDARYVGGEPGDGAGVDAPPGTTVIDVRDHVDAKVRAIAAHRSQYRIDPDMFPHDMLVDMYGYEYFTRVVPAVEPEHDLFSP